jgi:mannitol/fructose-specific phosphotransferase system IIA component (Ntr-type)
VRLSELLKEGQVVAGFQARDKTDALGQLLDVLSAQDRLTPAQRELVMEALVARERIASTGLENGIAIPHARVDLPGDVLAVLALAPAGIAFQAADGQPSRILILLIIPSGQMQKGIKLLAGAARLLSYEEVRDALLMARTPREALDIIRAHES